MKPSRNLGIAQRAANRIGRPLGILPFSLAWLPDDNGERSAVFDDILSGNVWQSKESVSGPGSELLATAVYRRQLVKWLRENNIRSMFDAACGDLNWMPEVLKQVDIRYSGGDVSPKVVEVARSRHPDIRQFDICEDPFPDADVWHCRDTLLHLSFADIWRALENVASSSIRCVLLTTHRARFLRNEDIETGGVRPLDLTRPPFSLPKPTTYLKDRSGGFPRAVGVWPIIDIIAATQRRP